MTESEAIQKIISKPKYYLHVGMTQSQAASFVRSWRGGSAKRETIEAFLNKFGYTLEQPAQWVKQLEGKPSNLKTK